MAREDHNIDWHGFEKARKRLRLDLGGRIRKDVKKAWRWALFWILVLLVGLMAAIASYTGHRVKKARDLAEVSRRDLLTRLEIRSAAAVLEATYLAEGEIPADWQSVVNQSLRYESRDSKPSQDFWGRDYTLDWSKAGLTLRSAGADGLDQTADDIVCVRRFEER